MTVLVVGGSGFVGRNLTRSLTFAGKDVVVLDRVPDQTGGFSGRFVQGDAQNAELVATLVAELKPDTVYHLAANSDIASGVSDASLDFGDTLMTTAALRYALEATPVERLVFASSSAIFGESDAPIAETLRTAPAPLSWYGKAKLASEYVIESLSRSIPDTQILMVRFPNVVGPLATHGVVYDFVRKLRADPEHLDVLGDGHQTKPYLHVSELLNGIHFFEEQLNPGVTRINIGPPDTISVREIVLEVTSALGVEPDVTYQESPFGWPGDVPRYSFDTSRMNAAGFRIATTSRQAVRRTVEQLAQELESA